MNAFFQGYNQILDEVSAYHKQVVVVTHSQNRAIVCLESALWIKKTEYTCSHIKIKNKTKQNKTKG